VYYHFRKWSHDGSLKRLWVHTIAMIKDQLDLSNVNLDGSHTIAQKGGEAVAYQPRKRAKTSNILPLTDRNGFIIASTDIIAGNHHDAFELSDHLTSAFRSLKCLGLSIAGAYFNADAAFDTRPARKVCFNHQVIPNIAHNLRNRKRPKPGPKRWFDAEVYKNRFCSERSFAWMDKFRALLVRYDRRAVYFMGSHFIAFAMINLRDLINFH
jgi:transposase